MLKNSVGNKVIPTEFAQFNFFLVMKIDFRASPRFSLAIAQLFVILSL